MTLSQPQPEAPAQSAPPEPFARPLGAAPRPRDPARPRPTASLERAAVLDIPLAIGDYESTMDWMDEVIRARRQVSISAAAVHLVMLAQDDAETRAGGARDGHRARRPAARLGAARARPLRGVAHLRPRADGPLLRALRHRPAPGCTSTAGATRARSSSSSLNLRHRFPGLQIAGGYSPPFRPETEEERDAIAAEINASGADIVWVGTGQPKQEKWMADMRDRLDAPILAGVGAAFDFHAGLVPQAPPWMQTGGLEWTFRLAHEPRRLWRRYARYNPRFVAGFARQWVRHSLVGSPTE